MTEQKTTMGKALRINLDPRIYGTFAEIGAGQEVARSFFQAGKASHTVAKTISAYDMVYSDEIYGKEKSGRYVCESRLVHMLDKEFSLLVRRLEKHRGDRSLFFALANTVTTSSDEKSQSHGWMGVRFQTEPLGPYNDIIIHVRLLDRFRLQQQEALGVLGVNLMSIAFFSLQEPEKIIELLVDGLKKGQVSVDVLRFSGPATKHLDQKIFALELVKREICEAVLFNSQMEMVNISDSVYGKNLVILRGSFHSLGKIHVNILDRGIQFAQKEWVKKDSKKSNSEVISMFEMTTHQLNRKGANGDSEATNTKELLGRIQAIAQTGHSTLISNFFLFYKLKSHLRLYTKENIAMIIGASHLDRLFDNQFYSQLEGGILEGLGKLLFDKTSLFIYPHKTKDVCLTSASYFPKEPMSYIYQYFRKQDKIIDIADCEEIDPQDE